MKEIIKLYDKVVGEIIEGTKEQVLTIAQIRREDYYRLIDKEIENNKLYGIETKEKPKVYVYSIKNDYYMFVM